MKNKRSIGKVAIVMVRCFDHRVDVTFWRNTIEGYRTKEYKNVSQNWLWNLSDILEDGAENDRVTVFQVQRDITFETWHYSQD